MEQLEARVDVWVWMGMDGEFAYYGAATTQKEALFWGHRLAKKVGGVDYFHFAKGDVLKFENIPTTTQNPYEEFLHSHPELFKAA